MPGQYFLSDDNRRNFILSPVTLLLLFSQLSNSQAAKTSLAPRWDEVNLTQNSLDTGVVTYSLNGTGFILEAQPLGVSFRMPWLIFLIGTIINSMLVLRALTFDILSKKQSSTRNIMKAVSLGISLMETFAGLIHYWQNFSRRPFIQNLNGSAYMSLLATVASIYNAGYLHASIFRNILVLVSIVNSASAIIHFVLLSLPEIGTSPLYQLWSPYCTTIVDSETDCGWSYSFGAAFQCANETILQLRPPNDLPPSKYNYVFASMVGTVVCILISAIFLAWCRGSDPRESKFVYNPEITGNIKYCELLPPKILAFDNLQYPADKEFIR
jgi:hypothetical protein